MKIDVGKRPDQGAATEIPTDVDFSCVVSEAGEVFWKLGVTTFEKLAGQLPAGSAYAKVEILPQNGETYPYLHPDGEWKLFVIGETPEWFTDAHAGKAWAAFAEWKAKAYDIVDLERLLHLPNPREIEARAPTEEDIANLIRWAELYDYMTGRPRNSVLDTLTEAVGASIVNDAWDYVFDRAYVKNLKNAPGSAEKRISQMAALIGSAFPGISQWKYYVGEVDGYPFQPGVELARHGYLVSSARDWNLHSAAANELVYTLPISALTTGSAFACVVDGSGKVYARIGADYCSDLIRQYGLAKEQVVQINVVPERYFEADSPVTVTILNGETPLWYTDAVEAKVLDAYAAWHRSILERIDSKGLTTCLTDPAVFDARTVLTESIVKTMKEWVAIWNRANDAGVVIHSAIAEAGWKVVGPTVWSQMHGRVIRNFKLRHAGCPGPATGGIVEAFIGERLDPAVDEFMGNTNADSSAALVGSFVPGLFRDENGAYLYQAGADLWNQGCIPMYDGTKWYLLSGPDGDMQVIYSGTNDQLLAD